jgi:8-oxo-dGTP pyrophosphatase MutT (NUDIX family)
MNRLEPLLARLRADLAKPRGLYRPLLVAGAVVGRVRNAWVDALAGWTDRLDLRADRIVVRDRLDTYHARTDAFDEIARGLSQAGLLTRWRDERYRVGVDFDQPLFELERAAARFFGIRTWAAHANGLVRDASEPRALPNATRMWIARRSVQKPIDPGMLDNLVGGGIPAGHEVHPSVVREAWEEAGVPPRLASTARLVGTIDICREVPDGLQVETVFTHDLVLPSDFTPTAVDGEVAEHRLCTLDEVFALASEPAAMTLDATLVAVDCLIRCGYVGADDPGYGELVSMVRAGD